MENTTELDREEAPRVRRRSAGVIVCRRQGGELKFLILRAWSHWDFPKGAVERGESDLQAAIRETAEETALTNLDFRWGESSCATAVYSRDKIARYFLAESPEGLQAEILRNPVSGVYEHEELRWVGWSDLPRFLPPRLREVMAWAAERLSLPPLSFEEPRARTPQREAETEEQARRGVGHPSRQWRERQLREGREAAGSESPQEAPKKERRDQFGRIVSRTKKGSRGAQ
jgi:8-oxo-dGTP pyrophosphatase MutT (NUDIX family)